MWHLNYNIGCGMAVVLLLILAGILYAAYECGAGRLVCG